MNEKEIKESFFTWAHKLKDKEVSGKKLYDYFEYNGINLWWFCIIGVCQEMNQYQRKVPLPKKELNLRMNIFPKIELLIDFLNGFIGMIVYSSYKKKKDPVTFVTMDRYWKDVYNPETKNYEKVDDFFDSLIKENQKFGKSTLSIGELQILQTRSLESFLNLFNRRVKRPDSPYASIESFWNLNVLIKQFRARRHFRKIWRKIKGSSDLHKILYEKGDILGERLMNFFDYYFQVVLPRKMKLLEMSRNFLNKVHPEAILLQNERGGWEQILIYAAREKGIKTIALQHGVVYKLHEGYFQLGENKENKTFPDVFCVFGPEVKNILVKELKYNKKMIEVVGQPRYDKIKNYLMPDLREKFIEKYGIDKDKKIFLIATQPLIDILRDKYFNGTMDVLKKFKQIQIIIKPHPAEKDISFYKHRIKENKINAVILDKKLDTFEALTSCDYFITLSSTVALEAMMFKKPVFIFNFPNSLGTLPWTKENAAIEFNNKKQATEFIQKILKDNNILKPLLDNGARFLRKYYYNLDGKATERIYKIINKLTNDEGGRKKD
ncbi:hypothetical protein COU60_00905 [Candidatus Pacearchaeota archaeon CG10_big_fil_rev_8_21_14_0_10_34_76]|nr:MAG: hypothetical protein COU60_00905 [Candidatus Pacearchaeota archaeon CG10_big_fil_rev_8_21_14_0_10_34_76]